MDFIILISLIAIGYFGGTWAEKQHYRSIEQREKTYLHLPAITVKNVDVDDAKVQQAKLVYGSVVISIDYFKRILAGLRNIFGGTVKSYETLVDRARREALLRMKEMAPDSAMIVNVRIETSTIGKNAHKKGVGCLEAIAYGTALFIEK
ncbi:YbjQ family protein [Thermodesulfobacteriota bacterium]|jgi:uncharacterized protein YbjQ (UPF0145 family)